MPELELRHLEYFCRSVELGSISRAAAALQVSQPTMSRQLARLRRQFGIDLLERSATGVVATEAGRALYERARDLLDEADRLPAQVKAVADRPQVITLGLPSGIPRAWFSAVIRRVANELPRLRLELVEEGTHIQRRLLQRAELDIALLHTAPPESPTAALFWQVYGVATPPGTERLGDGALRLEDLTGLRLLTHVATGTDTDDTLIRHTARARHIAVGWIPRAFTENVALVALASEADGVVLTAESANHRLPNWVWTPLADVDVSGDPLGVRTWVAWRDASPSHVRNVISILRTTRKGLASNEIQVQSADRTPVPQPD